MLIIHWYIRGILRTSADKISMSVISKKGNLLTKFCDPLKNCLILSGGNSNLLGNCSRGVESDRYGLLQREEGGLKNVKLSVM